MTGRKEREKTGQFASGNPGRPKGAKNKFTSLKDDWIAVHERMGGIEGLLAYAQAHPGWFYTNECRLFPQEVAHSGVIDSNLTVEIIRVKDEIAKVEGEA